MRPYDLFEGGNMAGNLLFFFSPGAQTWQQIDLPEAQQGQTLGIGRGADNYFVIDDPGMSTKHALLLIDPQGFYILDQFSSYGIMIDGQPIPVNTWVPIAPGVVFTLGSTSFCLGQTAEPQQVYAPPSIEAYPTPMATGISQPAKKRFPVIPVVGGGILLLVAIVFLVVWLSGSLPAGGTSFKSGLALTLADGETQTDVNGVSISIPDEALTGGEAQLATTDLDGDLAAELRKGYQLISPAYALVGVGAVDGTQSAELSFPAEQGEYRLLAIIDGNYVAEMDIKPENGKLTIPVDIHPSDNGELVSDEDMWQSGSIQYVLVRPKQEPQGSVPSSLKLAAPVQSETHYRCYPLTRTFCFQNGSGSVQVMFDKENKLTADQTEIVITYVESNMQKYEDAGFDGAIFSGRNPVQVVVIAPGGPPYYKVANGAIYLPFDIAKRIADGGKDEYLVHEMAHWVQDEHYWMTAASATQDGRWWIETSAENMVMMINPDHVGQNLTTYGSIDADGKSSVLQVSPYQWPNDESYAMAQLLKVNICNSDACPLSEETFIEAIDWGYFPFNFDSAREKIHANLPDYARYLLGVAPEKANTQIPLGEVVLQQNFGDAIDIHKTASLPFEFAKSNGFGRFTDANKNNLPAIRIEATLQRDGVYPLHIFLRPRAEPDWPVAVIVEAGAPYYYRIDNGEVLYNDGKTEQVFMPIMKLVNGNEITDLRIVAVGLEGGEVFKARVEVMDLSGMWWFDEAEESAIINNLSCEDPTFNDTIMDDAVTLGIQFPMMVGDYLFDVNTQKLTWTPNQDRAEQLAAALAEASMVDNFDDGSTSTFSGVATMDDNGIKLVIDSLTTPRTKFPSYDDPDVVNPQYISVPGSVKAEVVFDKIEYVGTTDPEMTGFYPNTLVWRLTGSTVTYTIDVILLDQTTDRFGNLEEEERMACTGTALYPASLSIYQQK